MDFIEALMAKIDADTDARCANRGQWTLGMLKVFLENADGKKIMRLGDGYPGDFHSYRGYYRFISLETSPVEITVSAFLKVVTDAIGSVFEGYKGGDFLMTQNTPVWVSGWGFCSGNGIVGVDLVDDEYIIDIANIDD